MQAPPRRWVSGRLPYVVPLPQEWYQIGPHLTPPAGQAREQGRAARLRAGLHPAAVGAGSAFEVVGRVRAWVRDRAGSDIPWMRRIEFVT